VENLSRVPLKELEFFTKIGYWKTPSIYGKVGTALFF
jgi:hypothetical protein